MRNLTDIVKGRIVDYDERTQELLIRAKYHDWQTLTKRQYKDCLVQLVDARPLSDKQRKACYALMREISRATGQGMSSLKEEMKAQYMEAEGLHGLTFSLADAPMSLVCGFQRHLIDFIVDWDIPTKRPLMELVDDIPAYIYKCLEAKKCCICGLRADLHHVNRVGMGRNREEIIHEGMEVLPLCREHHTEQHTMPDKEFFEKYHLPGGIKLTKELCDIYGLNKKEE